MNPLINGLLGVQLKIVGDLAQAIQVSGFRCQLLRSLKI